MFEKENAFFKANFPSLLAQYNGKEVVIADDKILGVYDSIRTADEETIKTRKPGTFTIKHVDPWSLEPIMILGARAYHSKEN
jgi:hypothetical protein